MKKNILLRTNLFICLVIITGFLLTAVLSYRASYISSLENIEQVSDLTAEGIYYQITSTFTKPVNISLTMANDSLLKELISNENAHLEDNRYIDTIKEYLNGYKVKYGYDSIFLVSTATNRYYNYNGLDRVLKEGETENEWYYDMVASGLDYSMNVDNDEVEGAENQITVFVNCKIYDNDNVVGIVGVGVRIDSFQSLMQSYQEKFGVSTYLIDHDGTIEISPTYSGYEHIDFFNTRSYSRSVQQDILGWKEEGKANSFWLSADDSKGKSNYLVTRYIPELDWHLVAERNTGTIVKKLNFQLAVIIIVIAVILLLILLVITHVIRKFNRQIVSLARSSEEERHSYFEKATEKLFENIYEIDITNNCPANRATEDYFESLGAPAGIPFDKALFVIARKQIKEEFRQGYLDTFLPANVMKAYEEGLDTLHYEFMISADGENYYWMRITARLVLWGSDQSLHMLVFRQNIDEEKRKAEFMQELAQRDEMTGLLTKTATQRQVDEQMCQEPERMYAFFIFDIDNFKQANDQFGHAFGDEVIQRFTQIIRETFRRDDILGRIGGDEFIAFVPISDEQWAVEKARALSQSLDFDYCSEEKTWHVSASIGVSFACDPGQDFESVYKAADDALYQTKKKGKNGFTIQKNC